MGKKVLIVKLSSLGDVLATTPLFRALHQKGYSVEHMVMKHCAVVTASNPYVSKQHVIDIMPSGSRFKDLRTLIAMYNVFRKNDYDAVLIMHISPVFQVLAKLARVKKIIGFGNRMRALLDGFIMYRDQGINRTVQEFVLAKLLEPGLETPQALEYYPESDTLPGGLSLPEHYIACNPGGASNVHSAMPNRCWPVEHYAALFKRLDLPVVILGYGGKDEKTAEQIAAEVPMVFNLVGRTTFDETARVISHAECYVGNDSSLLFLAAALGKPTLGIFGPTPAETANPLGPRQYAVSSQTACAPCYRPADGVRGLAYTCPDNVCMKETGVERVYEALMKAMGRR
jgi:ADP-heptose:LPS heptosyltransferase